MADLPEPGPRQRDRVLYLVELSDSFRAIADDKVAEAWEAYVDSEATRQAGNEPGWRNLPAWVKQEREKRMKERSK